MGALKVRKGFRVWQRKGVVGWESVITAFPQLFLVWDLFAIVTLLEAPGASVNV